jgi:ABC-2 type transport system ATP-binding protein
MNIVKNTPRFSNKDPDNHSLEYLAEIKKHSKEISVMVKNMNEDILKNIKELDIVYHLTSTESGDGTRLAISVDKFAENSVNNVIWSVVKNNGNIISINTKDPSLEDVFVDVTSKKSVNK